MRQSSHVKPTWNTAFRCNGVDGGWEQELVTSAQGPRGNIRPSPSKRLLAGLASQVRGPMCLRHD